MSNGIDYGFGQTNIDKENGIRYGVINSNKLASHAWEKIHSEGTDLDYEEAMETLRYELKHAIKSVVSNYDSIFDCEEAANDIIQGMNFNLESTGDCTRYLYSDENETFQVMSDGDIMVTKSNYFSYCSFCSPCAPGAGYLESEGSVKTYCLGPEWFEEENMPYICYRISDGSRV